MSAVAKIEENMNLPATPMDMLQTAIAQTADMDRLKALMDLQERWEANQARKAFVSAMSGFKSEPIKILKTKQVSIPGGAKFAHATLADVVDGAVAAMSKHGLSHKWETKQENGMITVTCIVTHQDGHSERVTLSAPPDDSGKKNRIQEVASTVTYLERYTLMAACGLAAKDMDDDGRAAQQQKPVAVPDGYEDWKADMTALADEGTAKLQEVWTKSSDAFRRHAVRTDADWWATTKNKAAKVKVSA